MGPGSVRVAKWIGRLGVVGLPAVAVGLQREERVVRRHVAKLEHAGWLRRGSLIWGMGSILWLTKTGLRETGLGQLRAVKASGPTPELVQPAIRVGWTAARIERRGYPWCSRRELALEHERWEIRPSTERGGRLPDLAAWLNDTAAPIAIVVEHGHRRAERQKAILDAWREAIAAGQYSAVRYDTFHELTVRQLTHLADKVGLSRQTFIVTVQMTREQIASIEPAPTPEESPAAVLGPAPIESPAVATAPAPRAHVARPPEPPARTDAEREQIYRQVMGIEEPKRRRHPWR
jgi:hypothetical protein